MTLCAFDLLELDGVDLRPEPIEVCKRTLEGLLRREHRESPSTVISTVRGRSSTNTLVRSVARASYRSGWARPIDRAGRIAGSRSKTRLRQQCVARRRKIGANAGSPLPAALDRRGAQRRLLHREGTNPQRSRTTGLHSPHNRAGNSLAGVYLRYQKPPGDDQDESLGSLVPTFLRG